MLKKCFYFFFGLIILRYTYCFLFHKKIIPKNQPILITGAASGIGFETTKLLASKGFFVYATDINQKLLEKNLSKLKNVKTFQLDITKPKEIKKVVKLIENEKGHLFGLINNAGVVHINNQKFVKSISEMDLETEIKPVFEINVFGMMQMVSSFIKLLKVKNEDKSIIINVASIAGLVGLSHSGVYSATKFSVVGYSESLRKELKNHIRVSVIQPSFVDTPILKVISKTKSQFDDFELNYEIRKRSLKKIDLLSSLDVAKQILNNVISDPTPTQSPVVFLLDSIYMFVLRLAPAFIADEVEIFFIKLTSNL